MNATYATAAVVLVLLACGLLVVLAVEVIGAMSRRGGWVVWVVWVGIGAGALGIAASVREVPLSVAALMLTLAWLLWRQRKRIRWAAARGKPW